MKEQLALTSRRLNAIRALLPGCVSPHSEGAGGVEMLTDFPCRFWVRSSDARRKLDGALLIPGTRVVLHLRRLHDVVILSRAVSAVLETRSAGWKRLWADQVGDRRSQNELSRWCSDSQQLTSLEAPNPAPSP
jgi:hypothetical protein